MAGRLGELLVRENLCKFDHAGQCRRVEALAVITDQFLRQRRKNLSAIVRSPVRQDLLLDASAHVPVQFRQGAVGRLRDMLSRLLDQATQFGE